MLEKRRTRTHVTSAGLGLLVFLAAEQRHTGGCLPRFFSLGGAGGVRASPGTLTEGTHWPNLASKSGGTA